MRRGLIAAAIETSSEFGRRIYPEGWKRGWRCRHL
jgi:hypothetical protein